MGSQDATGEGQRLLQHRLDELVAVLGLAARWKGHPPQEIARSMLGVVGSQFDLDVAHVRLVPPPDGCPAIEEWWPGPPDSALAHLAHFAEKLPRGESVPAMTLLGPAHSEPPRTAVFRQVLLGATWQLVVRSSGPDFPTEPERLLLTAIMEQAAIAVETATLLRREQALQQRLALLSEASRALAASLDYEQTLQTVVRLAIPTFADACTVGLVGEDGAVRAVIEAHRDSASASVLRSLRHTLPPTDVPRPMLAALETGRAVLTGDAPGPAPAAPVQNPGSLPSELALTSCLAVPLLLHGRTLGAILLCMAGSGRRFSASDVPMAEELARRAARAIENARLHRQLEDALRVRDEFLAAAAHDLKTPLTSMKGLAQVLRRRLARSSMPGSEALIQGLADIDATATQMGEQIDELLDLTRLEMGERLELRRTPTDLVALVRRRAARQERSSRRHRIRVEAPVAELVGAWDAVRLGRVVDNLISNAIKFSPEGGEIRVAVATRQEKDGAWAELVIQDHGLGIPAADLPRIFERFRRADNVAGRIGGTGIGLASARQIIEHHGGTITAASREGEGSTFTVRLPLGPG